MEGVARARAYSRSAASLRSPSAGMTPYTPGRHVIGALVQNEQGVLAGVANLFAGRGYNIDSLVVGRTEIPELSRITIVVVGNHDVASINQVKSPLILAPWLH
jgi:predicted regulator of amino acid metabolism with ACT domain|eukprot:COSAG01_NODE_4880_length_4655_cov_16.206980_5_plen_103_part_00